MEDNINAVVAVYDNHDNAESAIKKLTEANIPMANLSIIGRGYHSEEKVLGFYNTGDRVKFWGKFGAFWGGLWGFMAGGMYITVPVIGPIVVLGYLAAVVMNAIEGAVLMGGMSALTAAFLGIGIPKNSILQYEQAIKANGFVVMVQGSAEGIEKAKAILKIADAKQVDGHCCKNKVVSEGESIRLKDAS